jgi:D-glycerate 3-kinase
VHGRTCMLALSGAQGSGKSSLAAQIVAAARDRGLRAQAASLDHFYLDRPERLALATAVHPLLVTRGVPGTHDLPLLRDVLDAVSGGHPLRVPAFDKGSDTRLPESMWTRGDLPLDLFVFEGWFLGVGAEDEDELIRPVNALETVEDADGHWRRYVNARLTQDYMPIWSKFQTLALLRAPSFAVVAQWRDEAEAPLRETGAVRAMSPQQMLRFVMHYQRLTEHALKTLPARADVVLTQNVARAIVDVTMRDVAMRMPAQALAAFEPGHVAPGALREEAGESISNRGTAE